MLKLETLRSLVEDRRRAFIALPPTDHRVAAGILGVLVLLNGLFLAGRWWLDGIYLGLPVDALPVDLIPRQSDWVDFGPILAAGDDGEWDRYVWGGFTASVIKRQGRYYLYYQGASGYRTEPDETVTGRAIGLALSEDGIRFTKVAASPVLDWRPYDGGEEGAVAGAAVAQEDGTVLLFYGANTETGPASVSADTRLARSGDGVQFEDLGIVLDHRDTAIWGARDELFPILAFESDESWIVYYLPNGVLPARRLAVAWGREPLALANTAPARSGGRFVPAWGAGSQARLSGRLHVLFISDDRQSNIEARLVSVNNPAALSEPVATYRFADFHVAAIMLDREVRTWFMYYRTENGYGVRLAPAGPTDTSAPTVPAGLALAPVGAGLSLRWQAADDPDTGVAAYRIYRDGLFLAQVVDRVYIDPAGDPDGGAIYEVTAVNFHNVEGPSASLSPPPLP